ncbi:hypothetical protein L0U85_11640 [Glycomyces sp. L485]|uniref:hypothetical protein n=1 Tax=Glycomyces sp. L485 TaxID=2909235 RepID=UPI001F4A8127|nr:hypothetical protein [Glycomyces sp. L485]MCH7231497.1 hypothetical protein [Glycomyces sp. L485]
MTSAASGDVQRARPAASAKSTPWTASSTTRVIKKSSKVIGSPWRVVTRRPGDAPAHRAAMPFQMRSNSAASAGPPIVAAAAAPSIRAALAAAEKRASSR